MDGNEWLPSRVKIGPFHYDVEETDRIWSDNHSALGLTNTEQGTIGVTLTGNLRIDLDTFIHEIFHALYHQYKLSDSDNEERIVSALSTATLQMFADNPEVYDLVKSVLLDEDEESG